MKKSKFLMASLILTAMTVPTVSQARDIRELIDFRLPMYQGVAYTPAASKVANGGSTVMNISDIEGGSYALDGYLVGYNDGVQYGNYTTGISQATRTVIPNWSTAKASKSYTFKCVNHSSVSYNALVTGSWCPDDN